MKPPSFWYPAPGASSRPLLSRLLEPAAFLYDRAGRFRRAFVRPHGAGVPVICIGNLSAGGTGKTPVGIAIARLLIAEGERPVFLSRGYGGRERGPLIVDPAVHAAADVGDEPLLLTQVAPTVIAADRVAGSAMAEDLAPSVILMDDGFQNPGLSKDLSLVVVDGETLFGNERVIPSGPLREPVAVGLARADAVIVLGPQERARERLAGTGLPLLAANLEPVAGKTGLAGVPVLAFAGIGRPEKFFHTLEQAGALVRMRKIFPDHHPYTLGEMEELIRIAAGEGLRPVTTEKDAVRVPPQFRDAVDTLAVEIRFDDPASLFALLRRTVRAGAAMPLRS